MSNSSGVSIIITCYKRGILLRQAVDSILKQNFMCSYEIIIVDDGSTDKETHQVLQVLEKITKVSIIYLAHNMGSQHARNLGIRLAKYEYIFMMDSDDALNIDEVILRQKSYLDSAIAVLNRYPDVVCISPKVLLFGDINKLGDNIPLTEQRVMKGYRVPIGLIYRKKDIWCATPYHETIKKWQDWVFTVGLLNYRKMLGKQNIIVLLDLPYYSYRIHCLTQRISSSLVCERGVLNAAIKLYPEIFKAYYEHCSEKEIVDFLLINSQKIRQVKQDICINCITNVNCDCIRKDTYAIDDLGIKDYP